MIVAEKTKRMENVTLTDGGKSAYLYMVPKWPVATESGDYNSNELFLTCVICISAVGARCRAYLACACSCYPRHTDARCGGVFQSFTVLRSSLIPECLFAQRCPIGSALSVRRNCYGCVTHSAVTPHLPGHIGLSRENQSTIHHSSPRGVREAG